MSDRRVPVYILVDCSESMVGPPLAEVEKAILHWCSELKLDPMAIETAWVSVISFSGEAKQLCPLTEISSFSPPALRVGPGTALGAALDLLGQCISKEVRGGTPAQKGDWKCIVVLLTDGCPTDHWEEAAVRFRNVYEKRAKLVALGCGEDVDVAVLKKIAEEVLLTKDLSSGALRKLLEWVSISTKRAGSPLPDLPSGLDLSLPAPSGPRAQVILPAHCSETGKGYLMRYRRVDARGEEYEGVGAYPVGDDYFREAAGTHGAETIARKKLTGCLSCPNCGRRGWHKTAQRGLLCGQGKVQVMFVPDVTFSMDREIDGIRDHIQEFVDRVAQELEVEVGLLPFRDLWVKQIPGEIEFAGKPFTRDVAAFKRAVLQLKPQGGGNNDGESSYDAMVRACRKAFDGDADKVLVVITDDHPHVPDGEVEDIMDVVGALRTAGIGQLHFVLPDKKKRGYEPFHRQHGFPGRIFNIRGSFHDLVTGIGGEIIETAKG